MTGWDATRRVELDAPWESFWLDIYEDPPIQDWLDLMDAATAALHNPQIEAIKKACQAAKPLIAQHNLTDRDGKSIEIELGPMSAGLFKAVMLRIVRELQRPADEDPKPNRAQRRERSSPKRRSPSASASTS